MCPPRIRLVTGADLPRGDAETRFLAAFLRTAGWAVDVAIWSDPAVRWHDTPLTVIRSTWDYPTALDRFLAWTTATAAVTSLHNPPAVIGRNVDKRYLVELGRAGLPVVPSRTVAVPTAAALGAIRDEEGWSDLVVKPAVGADGLHVVRVPERQAAVPGLPSLDAGWIVQPFLPSIHGEGERSVVLVDGRPCWAVCKHPPAGSGEFRVQERWGGGTVRADPDPGADTLAVRALNAAAGGTEPLLYARVDLIRADRGWCVAEVEAVEPSLYLMGDRIRAALVEAALRRRLPS